MSSALTSASITPSSIGQCTIGTDIVVSAPATTKTNVTNSINNSGQTTNNLIIHDNYPSSRSTNAHQSVIHETKSLSTATMASALNLAQVATTTAPVVAMVTNGGSGNVDSSMSNPSSTSSSSTSAVATAATTTMIGQPPNQLTLQQFKQQLIELKQQQHLQQQLLLQHFQQQQQQLNEHHEKQLQEHIRVSSHSINECQTDLISMKIIIIIIQTKFFIYLGIY